MSRTPPFFRRPNLHLSLTQLGSPVAAPPLQSSHSTPATSPFSTPNYSPFRSAGLKPSTPFGGAVQFTPRSTKRGVARHAWTRVLRLLTSKVIWILAVCLGLLWWWKNGAQAEIDLMKLGSSRLPKELFAPEITQDLQFFPASNPKIHYVGRWTSTSNRLRKDGTFPGVYFDLLIRNSTSLYISLHNAPQSEMHKPSFTSTATQHPSPTLNPGHLSFRPSVLNQDPAPPISLLARVDEEEYILLPNSSAMVGIRMDLDPDVDHTVRIVAPGIDDQGEGVLELEGVWASKGGRLGRVEGSQLDDEIEEEDDLQAENANIGESHRIGLNRIAGWHGGSRTASNKSPEEDYEDDQIPNVRKNMLLEIVTDSGSFGSGKKAARSGGAHGLLAGVMGWEYLLGEMYGIDHVCVGVDGMCLVDECIGGRGAPAGMGDVFFRSGPVNTGYFERPWVFQTYVPDVMIFNLGSSDQFSFNSHSKEYKKSAWDLHVGFEDAYVTLVKAIRQLAYPAHPAPIRDSSSSTDGYLYNSAPATIPIFIMRPFRGEMEQATQGAVARLRADGDKSVFWLDTSGWLDTNDEQDEQDEQGPEDFFLDEEGNRKIWRLSERGNQRVAIFLHMHMCRFLAGDQEKCAFIEPEDYVGKVYLPSEAALNDVIEHSKEKKLKKLFWGED